MPSQDQQPGAQRAWATETETWALLRQAARNSRTRPTSAETLLWDRLRNRGLLGFRFRRQQTIDRFIVDFYCREANLVIEVDGASHTGHQAEYAERQAEIERRGLSVLRFTNDEVEREMERVLTRIAHHLTPSPSPTSERGTQHL